MQSVFVCSKVLLVNVFSGSSIDSSTLVAVVGFHRGVLPEAKCSGEEDVREFLRDFETYEAVNEWTDEKTDQYLAVHLKNGAKAFIINSRSLRKRFSEFSKALKQRCEGGLALLKYKRDFNSKSRKEGEPLHSYQVDLGMAYDRAFLTPGVDEVPEGANDAQKKKNNEEVGALVYYEARKARDILYHFVNGLKKDLREILIRQDDLLKTSVETVVKRIASLEEESGGILKVLSVSELSQGNNPTTANKQVSEIEEFVNRIVEKKLERIGRSSQGPSAAAVRRGGKRIRRQRPGPKSTRTSGGVLMSKTVVDTDKEGHFGVNAVSLSNENVMQLRTRKLEFLVRLMTVHNLWLRN